MTQYANTIGKNTDWKQDNRPQTGLLPALPALGTIGSGIASAASGLGIGAAVSKLPSLLRGAGSAARSGASRAASGAGRVGSAAGGGTATGLAKLGIGTYALDRLTTFMNSGPEIAGVNILPVAVIGVIGIVAANFVLP